MRLSKVHSPETPDGGGGSSVPGPLKNLLLFFAAFLQMTGVGSQDGWSPATWHQFCHKRSRKNVFSLPRCLQCQVLNRNWTYISLLQIELNTIVRKKKFYWRHSQVWKFHEMSLFFLTRGFPSPRKALFNQQWPMDVTSCVIGKMQEAICIQCFPNGVFVCIWRCHAWVCT